MSFTARQRHCLEAMGLVAWTNTNTPALHLNSDTSVQPIVVVPESEDDHAATPQSQVASSALAGGRSSALSELAQWLVDKPLALFDYRGVSVNCIGPEQAQLLVVCLVDKQQQDVTGQLPMSAECTQLFELMMRAINLSRNGLRQCAVLCDNTSQLSTENAAEMVSTLCSQHTRAVLVLDPVLNSPATDTTSDADVMPVTLQPLWRIPHPQQLIQTPMLKRRAWESLKQLQKVLAA